MTHCPTCMRALDPIQDVVDRPSSAPSISNHPLFAVLVDAYGYETSVLRGVSRSKSLSRVRHVGYWVARNYFRMSYTEVGNLFSRDHTTVISGVDKVNNNEDLLASAQRVLRILEAE